MAIGVRPIGSRAIGDSAGEAMPRAVPTVDLTAAKFWQWFMPGVSSPGGGLGWSVVITAPTGQDNIGSDVGAGAEGQSLTTALASTDVVAGAEAQSLVTARTLTETGSGAEAQSLVTARTITETGAGAEAQSLTVARSSSEVGAAAEGETVFQGAPRSANAFTFIFENILVHPKEQTAFATLFENMIDAPPEPRIWYLVPAAANRNEIITVVGAGFGEDPAQFEGMVTLNSQLLQIVDWRRIVAAPDALSSDRIIDTAQDTADPEHDRIDFRIPDNATSGDVKVVLNPQDI